MILDTINHAGQYTGLNARLDTALNAMKAYTPDNYPAGKSNWTVKTCFCCSTAMKHTRHPARCAKRTGNTSM